MTLVFRNSHRVLYQSINQSINQSDDRGINTDRTVIPSYELKFELECSSFKNKI